MDRDDDLDGGDCFAPVLVTVDVNEAEMIGELLRREGVAARVVRVNASLLGVPQQLFETRVDVPRDRLAFARELLADISYAGAAEAADRATASAENEAIRRDDGDPGAAQAAAEAPAQPVRGVGIVSFFPAVCHLSARRPWTALVLGAGLGASVATLVLASSGGQQPLPAAPAFFAFMALVAGDVVGGMRAAIANRRGVRVSRGRQLMQGFVLLAVAAAVAAAVTAVLAAPHWLRVRRLEKFSVACNERAIMVENRDDETRTVMIDRVNVDVADRVSSLSLGMLPTELADGRTHALAPGATATAGFTPTEAVAEACGAWARETERAGPQPADSRYCRLVFHLVVVTAGGEAIEAVGRCTSRWGRPDATERGWLELRD